jgi:hypothetical protein
MDRSINASKNEMRHATFETKVNDRERSQMELW